MAKVKIKSKQKTAALLLGAHFSIAKGLHNALLEAEAYDCNALQLFTKNANTWKERTLTPDEIETFAEVRQKTGIDVIASHTSYLINLAGPEEKKHRMSCLALEQELIRSTQLQIPYVVLHPGAHMGEGVSAGISRAADSVNRIFARHPEISTRLLFETTAGQGSSVGHVFEQLARLMDGVENKDGIGICFDTCHCFAAGYDIRTREGYRQTMAAFDRVIGLRHLFVIHLNDTEKALGSRVDRHAHIGRGKIGMTAFDTIMNDRRFQCIPKIIETPKEAAGKDWDAINLKRLKDLVRRSHC